VLARYIESYRISRY